jgi:hypothetical protein
MTTDVLEVMVARLPARPAFRSTAVQTDDASGRVNKQPAASIPMTRRPPLNIDFALNLATG